MRLARGNRDRPAVVVAAAMVAAAVDTAVVAKVVVASEEATRNSLVPIAFVTTAKFARRGSAAVRTRDVLKRLDASRRVQLNILTKIWAGLDSNQRRRKASRFTVCPVWPLRYLPVCTTKAFGVDIARTLPLASSLANARRFS